MPGDPPFPGSKGDEQHRPARHQKEAAPMAETSVFLAGNLTSDPELHHSPAGTARATFRVAVSRRVRDGEGWRDGEPAFYSVVVWCDQAVHATESVA
jgi:single-strand DNA-binding protein